MSSDQVARLAATIEILTGAVSFLIAERVAAQPEPVQGDLLHILERAFSTPSGPAAAALAPVDPTPWLPIVAAEMLDAVRLQIGQEAAGTPSGLRGIGGKGTDRAGLNPPSPANRSEVAERAGGEHARAAVTHFERGRAVA